ncbi:hypothetical protein [Undibacterium parvum]|uniref:Uncharacterized protein n=1 Tax=Undibacterium parvum TaxID=401471 RepID=A0A3Q9BP14_9BURK|nr:hypothetical protein [Undibacterium parvum]AZP10571.1 hypothetical protein EJN92_00095 [Undibacterium parvum]AZP14317.1 hypothetical protein EJN92_21325 [Undibacterium parvum]
MSTCSSCFYGGVEAMRAYQRQTAESDQFSVRLEQQKAQQRAQQRAQQQLAASSLPDVNGSPALSASVSSTQSPEQLLITAVTAPSAVAAADVNRPTAGALRGSIINTTA